MRVGVLRGFLAGPKGWQLSPLRRRPCLRVQPSVCRAAALGPQRCGAVPHSAPLPLPPLTPPKKQQRVLPRCFTEVMLRIANPVRQLAPRMFKGGAKGARSHALCTRDQHPQARLGHPAAPSGGRRIAYSPWACFLGRRHSPAESARRHAPPPPPQPQPLSQPERARARAPQPQAAPPSPPSSPRCAFCSRSSRRAASPPRTTSPSRRSCTA